jgi:hypothetical protein
VTRDDVIFSVPTLTLRKIILLSALQKEKRRVIQEEPKGCKYELRRIWKEVVVACNKALSLCLPEGTYTFRKYDSWGVFRPGVDLRNMNTEEHSNATFSA